MAAASGEAVKFCFVFGWCAFAGSIMASAPNGSFSTTRVYFESGGKKIRADYYAPPTLPASTHAPIVLLHGAGGILFDGPDIQRLARQLVENGHPVYVVHYFNRTGTLVGLEAAMHRDFDTWLGTVRDAIEWVAVREAKAGHGKIGVYGYSLGAYLALAATSDNPRVGALVEQSGGLWNSKESRVHHLPATLLIHGELDQRVPFTKYAQPLVGLLRRRGTVFETEFFPNESHRFSKSGMSRVIKRSADFFHNRLSH